MADTEGGGVIGITAGLSTKFGNRVRSTPISEMGFIGAGVGAAIVGFRPVIEIMLMNFTAVCMDQITNHAAKLRFMSGGQTNVPMVIRMMTGAGMSTGGQHSDFLEAWFCHTPGIKVVAPSNPADAYGLMLASIRDDDPVIFIELLPNHWTPGAAPVRGEMVPIGKAKVTREGSDVTLIGYSRSALDMAAVADKLGGEGVSCEVIDLRTVSPIDMDTVLESVARTGRAVVAHEAVRHEQLWRELKAPVQRIGAKECPVPYSKPLETGYLYARKDIEDAVARTLDY